jgi:UPF0271 protein
MYDRPLPLLTLPGSAAAETAEQAGVQAVAEGFADRAYQADGQLVSRREPGAVFSDERAVADRALRMARDGVVTTTDGQELTLRIDSLCVHGDSPGAVGLARAVHQALTSADISVRAFAARR